MQFWSVDAGRRETGLRGRAEAEIGGSCLLGTWDRRGCHPEPRSVSPGYCAVGALRPVRLHKVASPRLTSLVRLT
jgi:hypothetical protein